MRLAVGVLAERVFEEVRTKRNLSYAPEARMQWTQAAPFGWVYVTAVDPSKTMKVMFDEIARLKNEPISDKEFAGQKALFITHAARREETTEGIAQRLGESQIRGGDWHLASKLDERIRAATPPTSRPRPRNGW